MILMIHKIIVVRNNLELLLIILSSVCIYIYIYIYGKLSCSALLQRTFAIF
jgi:hypothetical protein